MSNITLQQLKALVRQNRGRVMGLDVGSKTIGLAISDFRFVIASPLSTIKRKKFKQDMVALQRFIVENDVLALVVGWPLNMDGTEGPRCQSVCQFADNIQAVNEMPILFWDERLSTVTVNQTMLDAGLSQKRREQIVDKLAASHILQGTLDALSNI